jgi:Tfp pilus assembly protein PilO
VNAEKINEVVEKIPISLLLVAYLGYVGFDFYNFQNDPGSLLLQKKAEVVTLKENNGRAEIKLKQYQEFVRNLETKKTELRKLAQELQEAKASLSETIDIPAFMKLAITEAKKVGLTVSSLKPGESRAKEYYAEQDFSLTFKGVYIQLVAFLDRISNVTQIVRVENLNLHAASPAQGKFVELSGDVRIQAYKYVGSKADTVGASENISTPKAKTSENSGASSPSSEEPEKKGEEK